MTTDPAEAMAAVWRASRDEAQVLLTRIARLEQAVARALAAPPPPEQLTHWTALLSEQRAALEASRARSAVIAALLEGTHVR